MWLVSVAQPQPRVGKLVSVTEGYGMRSGTKKRRVKMLVPFWVS